MNVKRHENVVFDNYVLYNQSECTTQIWVALREFDKLSHDFSKTVIYNLYTYYRESSIFNSHIFFLFRIQDRYRAIYDYDKADADEISLKEGDMISNGEIVGEGWMQGTNMRTGETGMLPSNYVEKVWREPLF